MNGIYETGRGNLRKICTLLGLCSYDWSKGSEMAGSIIYNLHQGHFPENMTLISYLKSLEQEVQEGSDSLHQADLRIRELEAEKVRLLESRNALRKQLKKIRRAIS